MRSDIIDSAPCLYWEFNDEGKIIYANNLLCNCIGYKADELAGMPLEWIFPISTKIFYSTHFLPMLLLSGVADEIFMYLKNKSGEQVPVLVNARRINNEPAVNVCAGIVVPNRQKFEQELISARNKLEAAARENTELVRAQNELKHYSQELDKSLYAVRSHNQELRQFNKVVTHDLQEPIRKLFYYSDMLGEELQAANNSAEKTLGKIVQATERLRSILSGLQEYVWINEKEPTQELVKLTASLDNSIRKLRKVHGGDHYTIEKKELPNLLGDASMIERLFYFIIDNSIRYSKPGTSNRICVESLVLQRNSFRSLNERYDYADYLCIRISDEGQGFDPAFKNDAFDLFKKLHNNSYGRGLGLALSKKIMDLHDGFIESESEENRGTQINLFFPATRIAQVAE